MPAHNLSDEERFLRDVSIGDGCWEWNGTMSPRGYGVFHPYKCSKSMMTAARWLYCHVNGLSTDMKHVVKRKCGNKKCVNPDHMELA